MGKFSACVRTTLDKETLAVHIPTLTPMRSTAYGFWKATGLALVSGTTGMGISSSSSLELELSSELEESSDNEPCLQRNGENPL